MAEGGIKAKAAGDTPVPSRILAIDPAAGEPADPVEAATRGFDALLLASLPPVMESGSPIPDGLAQA
ncbi:MAG TPA: hypothetical protein VHG33_00705, partial [Woeseiaceae bacterium]|nr:hypothetical protein [Woeseiaceae bacterium]